ncbi:hypothetical protein PLESTB_000649900 [Pleodorina starrii]|uniref:Uncharacterized protein n=1 Tax=Pleodorina starrii TaxID=330485 RepID=A0A9W6F1S2_9CHLO|nr:hypothetical protein PLESTB_000649900 [Pleodorina starrii]GLC71626.1 hypothetical protein PLESTF_001142600 [Pleodorina starrii]
MMVKQLSMRPFTTARPRVRCSATATTTAPTKVADLKLWKPINLTKNNLVGAQGGETTRNIDGVVYYVSYDAAKDEVVVVDRKLGVRYPAAIDDQNRVRIDTSSPLPAAVAGFSVEAYQPVLRADSPSAETINGRVAMVGFLGIAVTEILTNQSALQQLSSPVGAAAAAAVGLLTLAASIAPAVVGRVPAASVVASENDIFPDGPLPYTWNALAEKLNGRVAMVGTLGLILAEQFARGGAALL